jgi:hypothetical protein
MNNSASANNSGAAANNSGAAANNSGANNSGAAANNSGAAANNSGAAANNSAGAPASRRNTRRNNMMGGGKKMPAVGTKAQVYHGTAKHTSGGLTKKDLMKTKKGRIVSRKKHAAGKRALKRLVKAGYKAKKGSFKLFKRG